MAIHAHHAELIVVLRPFNAWDVLVGRGTDIHLAALAHAQVIHVNTHCAVGFAGLGILETLLFGIEFTEDVHGEFLNGTFIKAIIADTISDRTPLEAFGNGEFLLVHPIGGSVDDLVHGTIAGNLRFELAGNLHHKEVVGTYECDVLSVGRYFGEHLLAFGEIG